MFMMNTLYKPSIPNWKSCPQILYFFEDILALNTRKNVTFAGIMYSTHFVHGKIREEDNDIVFHTDDESSVTLVTTCDHFDMVSHFEEFAQLMVREL